MHITRVTECDVISCHVNDGLGLLMRPDRSSLSLNAPDADAPDAFYQSSDSSSFSDTVFYQSINPYTYD